MGKNDFLSPKGIANASKAKGLQKLRFYCQVCAKQCRDQNGFKCHITSEAHLRQMELFGQNQSRFIDGYSEEFLKEFLQLMSISHRNSRVAANVVYNEFIANKQHTHMNSTRWTSLTEFVKYLGREGIATVDETPKDWFLTYTPEDREEKMRQQSQKRKQRAQEDASARDARLIEQQIARADHFTPSFVLHALRHFKRSQHFQTWRRVQRVPTRSSEQVTHVTTLHVRSDITHGINIEPCARARCFLAR